MRVAAPERMPADRFRTPFREDTSSRKGEQAPFVARRASGENQGMREPKYKKLREIVAANVRAHMRANEDIGSEPKLAEVTGLGAGQVNRILHAEAGISLETLGKLADACGVMAWRLLQEPSNGPNPPVESTEGQQLLGRFARVPRIRQPLESGSDRDKKGASRPLGGNHHRQEPGSRKKRSHKS